MHTNTINKQTNKQNKQTMPINKQLPLSSVIEMVKKTGESVLNALRWLFLFQAIAWLLVVSTAVLPHVVQSWLLLLGTAMTMLLVRMAMTCFVLATLVILSLSAFVAVLYLLSSFARFTGAVILLMILYVAIEFPFEIFCIVCGFCTVFTCTRMICKYGRFIRRIFTGVIRMTEFSIPDRITPLSALMRHTRDYWSSFVRLLVGKFVHFVRRICTRVFRMKFFTAIPDGMRHTRDYLSFVRFLVDLFARFTVAVMLMIILYVAVEFPFEIFCIVCGFCTVFTCTRMIGKFVQFVRRICTRGIRMTEFFTTIPDGLMRRTRDYWSSFVRLLGKFVLFVRRICTRVIFFICTRVIRMTEFFTTIPEGLMRRTRDVRLLGKFVSFVRRICTRVIRMNFFSTFPDGIPNPEEYDVPVLLPLEEDPVPPLADDQVPESPPDPAPITNTSTNTSTNTPSHVPLRRSPRLAAKKKKPLRRSVRISKLPRPNYRV